jgi:hypothetical protein
MLRFFIPVVGMLTYGAVTYVRNRYEDATIGKKRDIYHRGVFTVSAISQHEDLSRRFFSVVAKSQYDSRDEEDT